MYLDDPAFQEQHNGPRVFDHYGNVLWRDPDPGQIQRMCEAIRQTWNRREERQRQNPHLDDRDLLVWQAPVVPENTFNLRFF
jgi:hypothetical protein